MRSNAFVLYEHDVAYRPHASAYLRLLRPLAHPSISDLVAMDQGLTYRQEDTDVVILDRFWRPDVTRAKAEAVVERARRAGARFVYAVDDDLLNLPTRITNVAGVGVQWPTDDHRQAMAFLLGEADAVWVTTHPLRDRYLALNPSITVLPNCLDEGLLPLPRRAGVGTGNEELVIGYMGTPTHDSDLRMVLPALREVCSRHMGQVVLEIIGGTASAETRGELRELPVRFPVPPPIDHEYPFFLMWFTRARRWDVAIAPLGESDFNECKSDIKFLDYAAIGAASVCSRVPAYERTVHHRGTGMLVENSVDAWVGALDELLADADLRKSISTEAMRYLHTERTLARRASDWSSALVAVGGARGRR